MNIVHRDVKPENVMLIADTLCVVLVDFGVARTFHEGGSPFACTPCGSLQYCAPEVVRGLVDDPLSPRLTTRHDVTKLDLYGVGVMTYIMLSGSFPFLCKTKEMLVSQMDRGVKFPSSKWSTQSVDARDFVARLMDPVASERPSASAALAHLWLQPTNATIGRTPSMEGLAWDSDVRSRASLQTMCSAVMDTEMGKVAAQQQQQQSQHTYSVMTLPEKAKRKNKGAEQEEE